MHPGFPSPFGHRRSLLGHPLPAGELGLPCGRLTGSDEPDPNGVATLHTYEMRPEGVPSGPRGRRCSCGRLCADDRRLPHRSGCVPTPRRCSHRPGLALSRRHRGFMFFTRPAFPSPVAPMMGWEPLGFSPSFTPSCCQQRMSRRGQVLSTDPGYVTMLNSPPVRHSHSWRALHMSHHTRASSVMPALRAEGLAGSGSCSP
jgi:hypothetical protein